MNRNAFVDCNFNCIVETEAVIKATLLVNGRNNVIM